MMKRVLVLVFALCGWIMAEGISLNFQTEAAVEQAGGKFLGASFTDGPVVSGVMGGNRAMIFGQKKGGIIFENFQVPFEEGWVSFYFKWNKALDGKPQQFFFADSLGTPRWYNRFYALVAIEANGDGSVDLGIVEAQTNKRLSGRIAIKVGDWHHVAMHWKNINSGNADGEAEIYWDGALLKSVRGQRWNIDVRGKDFYVGSVDQHCGHSNVWGDEAFAMDDFELHAGAMSLEMVQKKSAALKLSPRDYADGQPVFDGAVKGGGAGQYSPIDFINFPYKEGAFFARVKLDEILPGNRVALFDSCGTPNWNDRIGMNLVMEEGGKVRLNIFVNGVLTKLYTHREVNKIVDWDLSKSHTVVYQWKNISSGHPDMELTCYLDGVNVCSMERGEATFANPARVVTIAGGRPPAAKPSKKDVLTVEECRFWRRNLSTAEIAELSKGGTSGLKAEATPYVAIPKVKPMTVDGTIDRDFSGRASNVGFFRDLRLGQQAVPFTDLKCGYDDKNLYLAWTGEFEDAKPVGPIHERRDAALWTQDSVEIIYNTPKGLAHLVVSAYGEIYDDLNGNKAWSSAIEYKATIKDRVWHGEAAIPLSEIALNGNLADITFCRNIKGLQTKSSSWAAKRFDQLGKARLAGDCVNLLESSLPVNPIMGVNQGKVKVYAPKEGESVSLSMSIFKRDGERSVCRLQRSLTKGSQDIVFDFTAREEGMNDYEFVIQDGQGRTIFSNFGKILVLPPLKVSTLAEFYLGRMTVKVDAASVEGVQPKGKAAVYFGQTKMVEKQFELKDGLADVTLETTSFKEDGTYQAVVTIVNKDGKELTRSEDFLYAGKPKFMSAAAGQKTYFGKDWFTPVYDKGVVKVWGRTYTWKDTLFPASVVAAGDEMLQEAPYFEYTVNGKVQRLSKAKVTPTAGTKESAKFNVAAADANLSVKAKVWVDYDGHIGYDLDLAPVNGAKIDHLSLVIPMNYRNAMYKLDGNETMYTPATRDVDKFPSEGKGFPFKSYVGMGIPERGFFFYSESDEGWLPYDRRDTERIIRRGERVEWRLNILDGVALTKLPTQRWGFMASPYRSLDKRFNNEDFRYFSIWPGGVLYPDDIPYRMDKFDHFKKVGRGNVLHLHMNWPKHTGGYIPDDSEMLKEFVKKAHENGFRVVLYLSCLVNEYEPSYVHYGDYWVTHPTASWFGRPYEPKTKYCSVNRCMQAPGYIDWFVGGAEKMMREYDVDGFYYDFGIGNCNNGLHGCGYEGTNSMASGATTETLGINVGEISAADRMRRPNSVVRANREVWRRMYNLVKEIKGEDGLIVAHTNDPARIFTFAFMDSTVHSETAACHGYGEWPSLTKYRLYYSRQDMGTHGDCILYNPKGDEALTRLFLAFTLPHNECSGIGCGYHWAVPLWEKHTKKMVEMRKLFVDFGIGSASWMPYYSNGDVVSIKDGTPQTNVSVWYKPEKTLLVASNVSKNDREFSITLSGKLAGYTKVVDAEGNKLPATLNGNVLTLPVKAEDFRLVELQK